MGSWCEIKVRASAGPDVHDDKEVEFNFGIFSFDERSEVSGVNGDKEEKMEEWELELLLKAQTKEYRGLASRLNFMSLDCLG
eukprot:2603890-Karenia_brevis.AAC.1